MNTNKMAIMFKFFTCTLEKNRFILIMVCEDLDIRLVSSSSRHPLVSRISAERVFTAVLGGCEKSLGMAKWELGLTFS